jgi:hypothetical protein
VFPACCGQPVAGALPGVHPAFVSHPPPFGAPPPPPPHSSPLLRVRSFPVPVPGLQPFGEPVAPAYPAAYASMLPAATAVSARGSYQGAANPGLGWGR